jgi:protein TonB
MLEGNRLPELNPVPLEAGSQQKQRRQMLAALALLLIALIAVFVKDESFWRQYLFPSSPAAESDTLDQTSPDSASQPSSAQSASPAPLKAKKHPVVTAAVAPPVLSPVVTNRAVLPPLEVEVVAGDQHQTIRPGNPAIKVELQPRFPVTSPATSSPAAAGQSQSAAGSGAATDAAERVRLSPGTAEVVSHPVEPNYPLLARQMKVQGSVVLQALIGKEGTIQDLRVLSGPTILSAAAREAVKQWRFRPYLQSGQPVETEARITVNFTISTQ